MRTLRRNQKKLWYASYTGDNPITDENGDFTGDTAPEYSTPVAFYANASAARGTSQDEVFGKNLIYSRSIVTCDMTLPIDEHSLIWIEKEPVKKSDGTFDYESADYSVVQVAKNINSVAYAVSKLPENVR